MEESRLLSEMWELPLEPIDVLRHIVLDGPYFDRVFHRFMKRRLLRHSTLFGHAGDHVMILVLGPSIVLVYDRGVESHLALLAVSTMNLLVASKWPN